MDAFAVCVSSSMAHRQLSFGQMLRLPLAFAAFQAGMPALGWTGATVFRSAIESYDHWIAFLLLAAIGAQMVIGSRRSQPADAPVRDPLRLPVLLALAVATSIDALAAGIGLAVLDVSLVAACSWIGGTTLVACVLAIAVGRRLGAHFASCAETVGGLVLIGLGVKILVEHLGA